MNERRTYLREVAKRIKEKYGCQLCPETQSCCLEFHHLDPETKKGTVHKFVNSKSLRKTIAEINKCVVTCANCHKKAHCGIVTPNGSHLCDEKIEDYK